MNDLTMPTLRKLLILQPELITRVGTSVKIENAPYMALCIENIGLGPRSQTALSVAHYGEQNGDLMCDPEMCFELDMEGETVKQFHPYYFRNDYVGCEQYSVIYHGHDADNKPTCSIDLPLMKGQREFAEIWDRNLAAPGVRGCFREEPGAEPQIAGAALGGAVRQHCPQPPTMHTPEVRRDTTMSTPAIAATGYQTLSLTQIHESPTNPRRTFEPTKLAELAESLRIHGLVQPITVRPDGAGFEIVAGARRFRAAQLAGLTELEAIVRDLSDGETLEVQIVELSIVVKCFLSGYAGPHVVSM